MPRKPNTDANPHLVRIAGRRSWYIRYKPVGQRNPQTVSTGTPDESQARLILADFKARLSQPDVEPRIKWYLDERLKRFDDASRLRSFHKPLKAFFGDYLPTQITDGLVADYLSKRPATSGRRELEELRAAIPEDLRVRKIHLPAPRPPRELFMTRPQGAKLIAAAAATYHVHLFVLIGLSTGQRAGAILDLTWDRVLWDSSVLDFRNPEMGANKKRRGVCPIDRRLMAILQEAQVMAQTDRVIEFNGQAIGSIKKAFQRAAERAGLDWVSPHVMKHSVISWLAQDGYTVDQISDMTDTHPSTVRRIYRKVNPGYLKDLASSLGDGLFAAGIQEAEQPEKEGLRKQRNRKPTKKAKRKVAVSR